VRVASFLVLAAVLVCLLFLWARIGSLVVSQPF
jgi:hypothetical protein